MSQSDFPENISFWTPCILRPGKGMQINFYCTRANHLIGVPLRAICLRAIFLIRRQISILNIKRHPKLGSFVALINLGPAFNFRPRPRKLTAFSRLIIKQNSLVLGDVNTNNVTFFVLSVRLKLRVEIRYGFAGF